MLTFLLQFLKDAQESLMFFRGVASLREKNVSGEFDSVIAFINFYNVSKKKKVRFSDFCKYIFILN